MNKQSSLKPHQIQAAHDLLRRLPPETRPRIATVTTTKLKRVVVTFERDGRMFRYVVGREYTHLEGRKPNGKWRKEVSAPTLTILLANRQPSLQEQLKQALDD